MNSTDYYTAYEDTYQGTSCGSWYIEYEYAYTECTYNDDGEDGNGSVVLPGGGGGGGSSGGGGDPAPNDCSGVSGGSAYLDECGECVGGNTGKTACDPCSEMNNELAAIYQEYNGGMMAVKRKVASEVSTGPCCGPGYININGSCVSFESVSTESSWAPSISTTITKRAFTRTEALNYFVQQKDLSARAATYGFSFPGVGVVSGLILDKLKQFSVKWGSKVGGVACGVAMAYWETFFQRYNSIYEDIHTKFAITTGLGLYEITTKTTMNSPNGYMSTSTQIKYYTTDGCLYEQIFY